MISPKEMFIKEYDSEAELTRKMLSSIPDDKFDWKPHEKSMTLKVLSNHLAELGSWLPFILEHDKQDFEADPYIPNEASSRKEVLEFFEESFKAGRDSLVKTSQDRYEDTWKLCHGEMVFMEGPRWETVRHVLNQITHHRAQLGVYLRLLDVPVPGSYGGSADDDTF